jgi:hypothetical protein
MTTDGCVGTVTMGYDPALGFGRLLGPGGGYFTFRAGGCLGDPPRTAGTKVRFRPHGTEARDVRPLPPAGD